MHRRCPRNLLLGVDRWKHERAASVAARAVSSLPADAASVAADGRSVRKDLSSVSGVKFLQLHHKKQLYS